MKLSIQKQGSDHNNIIDIYLSWCCGPQATFMTFILRPYSFSIYVACNHRYILSIILYYFYGAALKAGSIIYSLGIVGLNFALPGFSMQQQSAHAHCLQGEPFN